MERASIPRRVTVQSRKLFLPFSVGVDSESALTLKNSVLYLPLPEKVPGAPVQACTSEV